MFALKSARNRIAATATGTRQRKRALRGVVGIALAACLLGAVPAASHASAYGYQYWAATWTGGVKVLPAGQLFHAIEGSGTHIRVQTANYLAVGQLCDTSIKYTYGTGRTSTRSNVRRGCSRAQQWKYRMNRHVLEGQACAELWAENWRKLVATQCHRVTR